METPATDIANVIRDLTKGSPAEQTAALQDYFLEDAAFIHPFVRVPRFKIRFRNRMINSRMVILAIYRWYKFLSPRINLSVDSAAFDQTNNILYASVTQDFSIWFIPFYNAHVHLVTVLRLSPYQAQYNADGFPIPGDQTTRYRIIQQEDQYQINEWLRFITPGVGAPLWAAWQIFSAGLCIVCYIFSAILTIFIHAWI